MKKLLSIALILCLIMSAFAAAEEEAAPAPTDGVPALQEGEMYFHGYRSEAGNYYIGLPVEWAPLGAFSPAEYIDQAEEFMDYYAVRDIISAVNEKNDVLVCVSEAGESLTLTYGPSEGAANETLIDQMSDYQAKLTAQCPGIQFSEECGEYNFNELNKILFIGANYMNHSIGQYFLVAGGSVFVFTFTDVETTIAQAVLSTFQLLS